MWLAVRESLISRGFLGLGSVGVWRCVARSGAPWLLGWLLSAVFGEVFEIFLKVFSAAFAGVSAAFENLPEAFGGVAFFVDLLAAET